LSTIKPYVNQDGGKKEQVTRMFDAIAPRYDFLNHFLSMGIDKAWRKKAIRILKEKQPRFILDVATGTADFAIEASKISDAIITGIDISEQMLEIGKQKILRKGLTSCISLEPGDSEKLRFTNSSFDAVTVAFGVRNFENLSKGLSEIHRVLKSNGLAVVLEFSKPTTFPFKQCYYFYFKFVLPLVGRFVSKDNSAYTYLPESVKQFPDGDSFLNELKKVGFVNCKQKKLTFGVATIYTANKLV
jgi:demethylmenaquinone methyltransferase / 2-methoxy-6-polyprenyl-1,4-benzoquinol methylase